MIAKQSKGHKRKPSQQLLVDPVHVILVAFVDGEAVKRWQVVGVFVLHFHHHLFNHVGAGFGNQHHFTFFLQFAFPHKKGCGLGVDIDTSGQFIFHQITG